MKIQDNQIKCTICGLPVVNEIVPTDAEGGQCLSGERIHNSAYLKNTFNEHDLAADSKCRLVIH